ncbi:hypothetical protein CLAVI_000143 [Candidatus Clavichlamydia salmonicola]|uniref:hypothetical protein n=1 Tax=Candidatus Clavichlamydia salmonicola TaxID=469812 RepID=UPI001890D9AF|nr:hypothetical protein [Candidatus Clavichlamydia salmonicola]MBF5050533.1 hypothetical protein [Candidatus Clavichlamydia salmonicola]
MNLIFPLLILCIFVGIGLGFFLRLRYLGQLVFSAWSPLIESYERKWRELRELQELVGLEVSQNSSLKKYFIQKKDDYKKITAGSLCRNASTIRKIWSCYHNLEEDTQYIYDTVAIFEPKTNKSKKLFLDVLENLWATENKIAYHSFRYKECVCSYNGLFQRILFSSFLKFFGWEASLPLPKKL